jgi:hypothetical protein
VVTGERIGKEVCDALGLGDRCITEVEVRFAVGELVTARYTERLGEDAAHGIAKLIAIEGAKWEHEKEADDPTG